MKNDILMRGLKLLTGLGVVMEHDTRGRAPVMSCGATEFMRLEEYENQVARLMRLCFYSGKYLISALGEREDASIKMRLRRIHIL